MEDFATQLKQVSNELQLVRAELALLKDTVVNTNQQVAEIHALIEDVAQKIDIIDAKPLTNPTPKPRAAKRATIAQTPTVDIDVQQPTAPDTATPLATPRPAENANIKMPQQAKKKYNRDSYFKELYNKDPHRFDESMPDRLDTLPTTEPERRSTVYKILNDDSEMRNWLIEQAKIASQ